MRPSASTPRGYFPLTALLCAAALLQGCPGEEPVDPGPGGGGGGGGGSFAVVSVFPAENATNVARDAQIRVEFSGIVASTSVTSASFVVTGASGSVTFEPSGQVAVFTPAAPYGAGATVQVSITADVTSNTGTPLSAAKSWSFTVSSDATAPTVVGTNPDGGALHPAEQPVRVTFSEDMNPDSFAGGNFSVGGVDGGVVLWDAPTKTAAFYSPRPLPYSQTLTARVSPNVRDVAGNRMGVPFAFSFTTEPDVDPPAIISTWPQNGATVGRGTNVTVTFDEPVVTAPLGRISVTRPDGGNVTGSTSYESASRSYVFSPFANQIVADPGLYTVTVHAPIFDTAGNARLSNQTFTFRAQTDTVAPTVISTNPANNTSVPVQNPTLEVTFSEPIQGGSVTAQTFVVQEAVTPPVPVFGSVVYRIGTRTAAWTPAGLLKLGQRYEVRLSPGQTGGGSITDTAANALAPYIFSFTVADDTTAPQVVAFSPSPAARFVPTDVRAVVTFSEPVDAGTLAGNFSIVGVDGGVTYNALTRTATFTPTEPLALGRTYSALVTGNVRDVNDNRLTTFTWSFDTLPLPTKVSGPSTGTFFSPFELFTETGAGMAVWQTYSGTASDYVFSHAANGVNFSVEQTQPTATSGLVAAGPNFATNASSPRFFSNGVWSDAGSFSVQRVVGNPSGQFAAFDETGTFQAQVSGNGSWSALFPFGSVASGEAEVVGVPGGFFAAWVDSSRDLIQVQRFEDGGWLPYALVPGRLLPDGGTSFGQVEELEFLSDGRGGLVLAYVLDDFSQPLYVAVADQGDAGFGARIAMPTSTSLSTLQSLTRGGGGVLAVSTQSYSSNSPWRYAFWKDGTWNGPHDGGTFSFGSPLVAGNGRGFVLTTYDNFSQAVQLYVDGAFTQPVVPRGPDGGQYFPSLLHASGSELFVSGSLGNEWVLNAGGDGGFATVALPPRLTLQDTILFASRGNTLQAYGLRDAGLFRQDVHPTAGALTAMNTTTPQGSALSPQLVVSDDGQALVVWQQYEGNQQHSFASTRNDAGFSAPKKLSNAGSVTPFLTAGPQGALVAYVEGNHPYSHLAQFGTVSDRSPIYPLDAGVFISDVRVAGSDFGYRAVWPQYPGVFYADSADGVTWTFPTQGVDAGLTTPSLRGFASNGSEYAVAWATSTSSSALIFASVTQGGVFGPPLPLCQGQLSLKGGPNGFAAGCYGSGGSGGVQFRYYDGQGWGQSVVASGFNVFNLFLTSDPVTFVAWLDRSSGQVARLEAGDAGFVATSAPGVSSILGFEAAGSELLAIGQESLGVNDFSLIGYQRADDGGFARIGPLEPNKGDLNGAQLTRHGGFFDVTWYQEAADGGASEVWVQLGL